MNRAIERTLPRERWIYFLGGVAGFVATITDVVASEHVTQIPPPNIGFPAYFGLAGVILGFLDGRLSASIRNLVLGVLLGLWVPGPQINWLFWGCAPLLGAIFAGFAPSAQSGWLGGFLVRAFRGTVAGAAGGVAFGAIGFCVLSLPWWDVPFWVSCLLISIPAIVAGGIFLRMMCWAVEWR